MTTIKDLLGLTLTRVEQIDDDRIEFDASDGQRFVMHHPQDCCESVTIESITGDLADLVGTPISIADESQSGENPDDVQIEYQDSFTWTFYKLATCRGWVDIRWYGESNGYYSESVEFERLGEPS